MNCSKIHNMLLVLVVSVVLWGCGKDNPTGPKNTVYTDVSVIVVDDFGRPVEGALVSIEPETQVITTNEEGKGTFENIPLRPYTFVVRRLQYPNIFSQYVILDENNVDDLTFIVYTKSPTVTILSPQDNHFISAYNIRFVGDGTDLEDGALPDSSLVWYSDIDGELGCGKELIPDSVTLGNHKITLTGTDSDRKDEKASVMITVVDYNPDSYFPFFNEAKWLYVHQNKRFSIKNNAGETEVWDLRNIDVSIDADNRRISTMSLKVSIQAGNREYHYSVIDELEKDGGLVYVKKTIEQIKLWRGSSFGIPYQRVDIETVYTPHYILLKNVMDPIAESSYENTMRARVTWLNQKTSQGLIDFIEDFEVTISLNVGNEQTIQTDMGAFPSVPLTITQDNSVRTWWLSPGLGIVRLQYNTFDPSSVADIFTTNLTGHYSEKATSGKNVQAPIYTRPFQFDSDSLPAEDSPERLKEMRRVLRYLMP